jgi:DNA repair exonuclease SbcCD ATPase subunit
MAKRRRSALALTAQQAQAALAVLIQEGKLRAGEVQKALKRRDHLIRALRAKLGALEAGVVRAGRRVLKDGFFPMDRTARPAKPKVARRKPRISAATRKLYQQQGRYMAALRNLTKEQRVKVKAIREKSGVRAAIAAAKSRLAEQLFIFRRSKDSDQRRTRSGKRRSYSTRPNPKPDKHGGSGANRQRGGSGMGREHG